jgi:hypothetical protein
MVRSTRRAVPAIGVRHLFQKRKSGPVAVYHRNDKSLVVTLGIVLLATTAFSQVLLGQDDSGSRTSPAAAAMRSVFSPSRAPAQKTMGLLQRNFLDLAEQDSSLLQVAIVVDGTDSMATELAGVRQSITAMIDDLRRYRDDRVEVALVIYRDNGSPSSEVTIPLASFSRDIDAITSAVEKIVPESGAPFFNELADVGLHKALTDLPWSSDPSASRWVMLFGDAPPYDETFSSSEFPTARRRYSTELLVALAARKSIRINCVLCTSDKEAMEPYDKAVDQTRSFMNSLAAGTDGLMLDLSYPEIRTAIIDASRKPEPQYLAIEPITRGDLNTMSISSQRPGTPGSNVQGSNPQGINVQSVNATEVEPKRKEVTIAVIPHLPLDRMSFDPADPAVQVSTALRNNFSNVPGVRVVSPIDIQRQLLRLRADNVDDGQRIRALAARLGVDYVIWGSLEPSGPTVQTAAYRRTDGSRVVQVSLQGDKESLTRVLLNAASTSLTEKDEPLGGLMKRIEQSVAASVLDMPIASTAATRKEVLAAMESLEQALGLPAGSEDSLSLLTRASTSIAAAAGAEPRNPLVHWLGANTAYNLAAYQYGTGNTAEGESQMKEMGRYLSRAYRGRSDVKLPSLVTEIEADHALLVSRDIKTAINQYQAMTQPEQPSATRRRGHWMLSGIYAGDWGVAESAVDPVMAREHLVMILSNWPESPEAELLRTWMRWDDSVGKTKFSYLPIVNRQLAKMVPAEETKTPQ